MMISGKVFNNSLQHFLFIPLTILMVKLLIPFNFTHSIASANKITRSFPFNISARDLITNNARSCVDVPVNSPCRQHYQLTRFPNVFNYTHLEEFASGDLLFIQKLFELRFSCSPALTIFVCSLYFPICTPIIQRVSMPCQEFCTRTQNDCSAEFVDKLQMEWPKSLNCTLLKTRQADPICIDNVNRPPTAAFTIPQHKTQTLTTGKPEIRESSRVSPPPDDADFQETGIDAEGSGGWEESIPSQYPNITRISSKKKWNSHAVTIRDTNGWLFRLFICFLVFIRVAN